MLVFELMSSSRGISFHAPKSKFEILTYLHILELMPKLEMLLAPGELKMQRWPSWWG